MAEVNGREFLGLIKHIKENGGPEFLQEVLEEAGEVTKRIFSKRVLALGWYPYQGYVDLIKAIDRKMGTGDLAYCWKLGEIAANLDLGSFLNVYKISGGPEELIRAGSLVWPGYYRNAGQMQVVSSQPENTIIRIGDFPEMDPAHCKLMEGWITTAVIIMGAKLISEVKESKCMSKGDPYHEFNLIYSG